MLTASCPGKTSPLDVADNDAFLADADDIEVASVHQPHSFRDRS